MIKQLRYLGFSTFFALGSCTTIATHFPGVYAIDVEQGNIIDQDMINQLRPDMNKRQVLYVMGSPMLIDTFHQERWDYVYSNQPGGEDRVEKRISLYFQGDRLIGAQGDFRPNNMPVMRPSNEETVDVPKRNLQKTLFEKISGLFSWDDIDTTPPAKPAEQQPAEQLEEKTTPPASGDTDSSEAAEHEPAAIEPEIGDSQPRSDQIEDIEESTFSIETETPAEQTFTLLKETTETAVPAADNDSEKDQFFEEVELYEPTDPESIDATEHPVSDEISPPATNGGEPADTDEQTDDQSTRQKQQAETFEDLQEEIDQGL